MRKLAGVLMVFVLLWACAWAQGETIGFGRINKDEVNVRKAPGEEYIFRAVRGQNVFILGSETDTKGQEWYHVIIYRRPVQNGSRTEGWVMGRYVDVTDEASRDIVKVALNKNGYMALHEDGTVSGAEVGFFDSEELANLLSGLRDVRDIGVGLRTYVAAGKNGALFLCYLGMSTPSRKIFSPIKTSIMPPAISALLLYFEPNLLLWRVNFFVK